MKLRVFLPVIVRLLVIVLLLGRILFQVFGAYDNPNMFQKPRLVKVQPLETTSSTQPSAPGIYRNKVLGITRPQKPNPYLIWALFGLYLGLIGLYLGLIWASFGPHSGFIWALCGLYLGSICALFGPYVGFIWALFGPYLGLNWALFGLCLAVWAFA